MLLLEYSRVSRTLLFTGTCKGSIAKRIYKRILELKKKVTRLLWLKVFIRKKEFIYVNDFSAVFRSFIATSYESSFYIR